MDDFSDGGEGFDDASVDVADVEALEPDTVDLESFDEPDMSALEGIDEPDIPVLEEDEMGSIEMPDLSDAPFDTNVFSDGDIPELEDDAPFIQDDIGPAEGGISDMASPENVIKEPVEQLDDLPDSQGGGPAATFEDVDVPVLEDEPLSFITEGRSTDELRELRERITEGDQPALSLFGLDDGSKPEEGGWQRTRR